MSCLVCLVERDCDITIGDHKGNVALHYAAMSNHLDCVRFLLKQGASMDCSQDEGKKPLHLVFAIALEPFINI
jgi:ankyrin repeat protein